MSFYYVVERVVYVVDVVNCQTENEDNPRLSALGFESGFGFKVVASLAG
jgi:hypothetical protein